MVGRSPTGRILIVEDEPIIRMLLVDNLADAGYTVATARNGAEALDRVLRQPADMVLLDLLMPDMDGFTFLRVRQAHPYLAQVPVIVLSAAGIEGLKEASELRATAVLGKPVDLDVLGAVIEHVMGQWQTEPKAPRLGVQDRRGVHSIDAALNSAAMHRLWHDVLRCTRLDCRHHTQ